MLPKLICRLAAITMFLGVGSGAAWGQVFIQPSPFFSPYQGYSSWGTPYQSYTWGTPYQGYGYGYQGYAGYPAYSGYGNPYYFADASYTSTVTIPGWSVSGDSLSAGVARARATESPAMAVAANSPLLQVAYESVEPRAQMVVSVLDPNALVWVDGTVMPQQGTQRRFRTPALREGQEYAYEVVAQWTESCGQAHSVSRHVTLRPGEVVSVDLTK